jgi:uncharacterized protein (TIGR02284 family)
MKSHIMKAAKVLNGLLRINNDRVEYYHKASERATELNLKTIFNDMAAESGKNASALTREIIQSGGNAIGRATTNRSAFYRFWTDVQNLFMGSDRKSVVNSCINGEEQAQKAYYKAISANELTMQARQLVRNQQVALKSLYDNMMTFRNITPSLYPHKPLN